MKPLRSTEKIIDWRKPAMATKAVGMILNGSEHSSVYSYMERKRKDLKIARWGF